MDIEAERNKAVRSLFRAYLSLLADEAARRRNKCPWKKIAAKRRATVQAIEKQIGRWPEVSDVRIARGSFSLDDKTIAADLERLKKTQIKRKARGPGQVVKDALQELEGGRATSENLTLAK